MTNLKEQLKPQKLSPPHSCQGAKIWMAHILPVAILVLALWLPYGFSLIGLIEEWGLLGSFTTHGLFFVADTSSPLAAHALRPLTILPQAIAYYLDPYSFKYWNVLLALSLCVKGSSLSYITSYITGSAKWGVIAGLLIVVYPADTMQLSFRALHINWALSFLLLGTAIFIAALQAKSRPLSYFLSILAAVLLFAACAMYEASLLLTVLPFLAILAKSNLKSSASQVRQHLWKHLIWVMGAFTYIAYVIHTAPLVNSYQGGIAGSTSVITTLLHSLPNLFSIGLLRTTLGGWYDATRITAVEFSSYWYAISVTLIIFAALLLLSHHKKTKTIELNISAIVSLRLLIAGIILILLGYAPFLLSTSHQAISQRTFLFATPGGVFVTLAILIGVSKASKNLAALCVALFVFIGLSSQLYQFHHYVKISDRQRNILKNIVDHFDGKTDNKTLVIVDKTNQLNNTWMFINENLQATLNYIYGHPFNSLEVCREDGSEWQHTDSVGRKGTCEETTNEWIFHYPTSISGPGFEPTPSLEDKKLGKSETVAIIVNPDGASEINPGRTEMLRSDQGRTGAIYRGFIDKPDYQNHWIGFADQESTEHYFWGFGDWWSMELPIAGSGWREAEWTVNKFQHNASAWKTSKQAFLDFKFSPSSDRYQLHGMFDVVVNPAIKTSMKIEINGVNIPFEWNVDNSFQAQLTTNLLRDGKNTITFISDVDDKYFGFAGRLDWIEIKNSTTN
ncbi:glucosyltransferase domain-containing protein [Pseudomonas sp. LB1P83]